jgi:ABC-2 type transport system ATP-binding protein
MRDEGTTILLTTHYLEEAEALCDRIAIINHGRLIACETTEDLLKRLDSKELRVTLSEAIETVPPALKSFHVHLERPGRLVFCYPPSTTSTGDILLAIQQTGLTVAELDTHEADLEDVFLQLTGEPDVATGEAK